MPGHGSPNVALLAATTQDDFPLHSASSFCVLVAALQLPVEKAPHAPVGLP